MSRIIRKYPNRRLYDTARSRYVTLGDIRQLVVMNEPFTVVARATQRDITNDILLQVISLQEQAKPTLDRNYLLGMIRNHTP